MFLAYPEGNFLVQERRIGIPGFLESTLAADATQLQGGEQTGHLWCSPGAQHKTWAVVEPWGQNLEARHNLAVEEQPRKVFVPVRALRQWPCLWRQFPPIWSEERRCILKFVDGTRTGSTCQQSRCQQVECTRAEPRFQGSNASSNACCEAGWLRVNDGVNMSLPKSA